MKWYHWAAGAAGLYVLWAYRGSIANFLQSAGQPAATAAAPPARRLAPLSIFGGVIPTGSAGFIS